MTQQPFYPQAPGYPQGYPQQPQPQYPAAPQSPYPPQQYQQPFPQQAPQAPAQPLAQGTLDDFYNQPTTGGGPSISWKDKPIGTTYMGVVARDVTNGDVQQQVNFQSKQPEFYRDGRPKFVLKVPLKDIAVIQNGQPFQAPEFAENGGEGTYYVRGQARDELARAMAEAGAQGAPKAGDVIVVSLVQRKPSGQGMNPSNVVQIRYQSANGQQVGQGGAGAPSPAPAPVQQPQVEQAPVVSTATGQPVVHQQQVPTQPVQPQGQPVAPQQPVQNGGLQVPADFNAEQAALLARITGQPAA